MADSFFSKVTTRVDRERVYNLLVAQAIPITVVTESKSTYKFLPKELEDNFLVLTSPPGVHDIFDKNVVITFGVGVEKYFIKTKLLKKEKGSDAKLDLQSDLYKLQRRNSFRLNIPTGFLARYEIKNRGEGAVNEKYDLVDLSGGGLAFELPSNAADMFRPGELLNGRLIVGPDFSKDVKGVVRHSRMVGSRGSGLCRVGVEFQGIPETVQNELINIVMDLHREMFSKFKLGTR